MATRSGSKPGPRWSMKKLRTSRPPAPSSSTDNATCTTINPSRTIERGRPAPDVPSFMARAISGRVD